MFILDFFKYLFDTIFDLLALMLNPLFLIPVVAVIIYLIVKNKKYQESSYYQITKLPYLAVRRDVGRIGEYLTYKRLKQFEDVGAKFLFNVYIPKENGETSEIDVLMISSKGLFVFESKNYSGWIFGSENQKNWYQTLPQGRGRSKKENFYNPIMQNRSHIKHLKAFLETEVPTHSIIVFSERCTLKSVNVKNTDIKVIKRDNILPVVSAIYNQSQDVVLSESEIAEIHNKLYPFTQTDDATKAQHIANIKANTTPKSEAKIEPLPNKIEQVEKVVATVEAIEGSPVDTVNEETLVESAEVVIEKTVEAVESEILKCPKCGADLVLKTATRGANAGNQFYGCSNYPKCRYTQDVKSKPLVY